MTITDITVNNLSADIVDDDGFREYTFPANRMTLLNAKLDATNVRLERSGIEGRFTVDSIVEFDCKRTVGGIELEDGTRMFGTEVTEPWVRVTINMVPLVLGDFTFVASLVPEEVGIITHVAPGQDLGGHRPTDMRCEHCGLDRRRTRAYIVRNNETGELVQVGHSCIELYTGCAPKGLWVLGFDAELQAFADEETGGFSNGDYGVRVQDVLGMAFAFSDQGRSYVSRNAAEASWGKLQATGGEVRAALFFPPRRPVGRSATPEAIAEYERFMANMRAGYEYGQDEKLIGDILASAATMKQGTDYADNVAILVQCERVSGRNVGILASLVSVSARGKELAVQRERAPKAVAGFVAPVGTRVKWPVRLLLRTVKYWEGDYGVTTLLIGWDQDGHIVKWKASGRKDYEPGDTLVLSAFTVKAHDVWNEQDQTVIQRAVVAEVIAAGALGRR